MTRMQIKESTATNLRLLRRHSRLSQREVGEYLNMTSQAISRWETGDGEPSFSVLVQLDHLFGITTDDFISLTPERIAALPTVKVGDCVAK